MLMHFEQQMETYSFKSYSNNSNGNEEGLKCQEKVWEYLDIHSHDVNQVRQKINGKQI